MRFTNLRSSYLLGFATVGTALFVFGRTIISLAGAEPVKGGTKWIAVTPDSYVKADTIKYVVFSKLSDGTEIGLPDQIGFIEMPDPVSDGASRKTSVGVTAALRRFVEAEPHRWLHFVNEHRWPNIGRQGPTVTQQDVYFNTNRISMVKLITAPPAVIIGDVKDFGKLNGSWVISKSSQPEAYQSIIQLVGMH